ncbi:MAG TPA: sulfatase/phosphatase domain-containing protein, partial [Draconibacterium sp.]|nr:sulfatase/phosphatase domain-containing protein [Draconibacterium sp.]
FENFREFYSQKTEASPFFFWYGGHEPHRVYEDGSGLKAGKELSSAVAPEFLPETDLTKSDMLDFAFEIEWFDAQLGKMLQFLDEKGELENTIIVVTADNGMPFPSAKANLQEYGTHVPLAICWPKKIQGNRVAADLVGMIDLAPTFLEISGIENLQQMTGKSLSKILFSEEQGNIDPDRKYVFTGRERHTHARPDNLGYPARAVRTADYLYVLNFKPDRWPAGDPAPEEAKNPSADSGMKKLLPGYHDVDDSPSKQFLIDEKNNWPVYFDLAYSKRPAEQLYDIKSDPGCVKNLAENPDFLQIKTDLNKVLLDELTKQGDPRVLGNGDVFESYPRFGAMRDFPGFKERGKYNPEYLDGHEMINQGK